jgi:DNA-binding transcriptional regulator YiaG
MPNLGLVLKQEIARLSRRAIKPTLAELKRDNVALKRRLAQQQKTMQTLLRDNARLMSDLNSRTGKLAAEGGDSTKIRLGPSLIKAQRKRLGLSQQEFGRLLGVSTNTMLLWEKGKTSPREKMRPLFAAVRKLGRRDAKRRLEAMSAK